MKKKLLIFAGLLIIIVVALVLVKPKKERIEESIAIRTPVSLQEPKIPKYIEAGTVIESNINEPDFSFSKSLPVIQRSKGSPLGEEEAVSIAANLGFTSQPIITKDASEGTVYLWSRTNDNLVIYGRSRRIEYGLNQAPTNVINKQLSNDALIKISEDFIFKKFLSQSEKVVFSFFTFLKSVGPPDGFYQSSKEEASIFQVNFSPIESDYKILILDPRSSPIYTWVVPDGTISKAIVSKGIRASFSEKEYPLKNYREFSDSLEKAVLVSLDDGNILLSVLPKRDVQKITVGEIEIVYLIDSPDSEVIQPVFLLKGKAKVQGYQNEVSALLYLPAIRNP